jgi:hypothetical protein
MEINITKFFKSAHMPDYFASVAERGENAGPETWANANSATAYHMLDTPDKVAQMRRWARSSGGWNDKGAAALTDVEVNALFVQLVASDIREAGIDTAAPDWDQYDEDCDEGRGTGNLYLGDDGEVYYLLEAY